MASNHNHKIKVHVHPDTHTPDVVWRKKTNNKNSLISTTCDKVTPLNPNTAISDDKVRFVCISDTHARLEKKSIDFIPNGDVLLHAGDLTNFGSPKEIYKLNEFLGKLPHTYKVIIAGNHDMTFDKAMTLRYSGSMGRMLSNVSPEYEKFLAKVGATDVRDLLTNCTYLEDNSTEVYGVKIHGSPWTPEFCGWGFNAKRGHQCLEQWDKIPDDTDIVMTHGPPLGHGDTVFDGHHVGCVELLTTIQTRIQPAYHVYGHIHEGYGVTTDGTTTYINAAMCNIYYRPDNPPIVFDFPLPHGVTKSSFMGESNIVPRLVVRDTKHESQDHNQESSDLTTRMSSHAIHNGSISQKPNHVSEPATSFGVGFPLSQDAVSKIGQLRDGSINYVRLKINIREETIEVDDHDTICTPDLASKVPLDHARYHLYSFTHTHEGAQLTSVVFIFSMPDNGCPVKEHMLYSTFFIFSMPDNGCPVKERMLYSTCKGPLTHTISHDLNCVIQAKVHINHGSEITEQFLRDKIHTTTQTDSSTVYDGV